MAVTADDNTPVGKQVVHCTSDSSGVWSTDTGSLFTDAGCTVPYTGGSRLDIYVKVQNKSSSGTVSCDAVSTTLTITGVFPAVPHFPHEFNVGKRGVVGIKSRSGKISGRVLGDGTLKQDFNLKFNLRSRAEFLEVRQFVDDHYPGVPFLYVEEVVEVNTLFVLDGEPPMKVTYNSGNRLGFEVPIFMV